MSSSKIKNIKAREILDSRGNPTVECKVILDDGLVGIASVPSGASTGTHEALELRDGNKRRYDGKGVRKAVHNIERLIAPILIGKDPRRQEEIDRAMLQIDGTDNKSRLGANATLAVSLAVARAAATASKLPLYKYLRGIYKSQSTDKNMKSEIINLKSRMWQMPHPMMNILNGGAHANWSIDFQEFMIIPYVDKFSERVRIGSEIFHKLGKILKHKGFQTLVGDEGGYAPKLQRNEEALELIMLAIREAGFTAGKDVFLAMDVASSEFYKTEPRSDAPHRGASTTGDGKYELKVDGKIFNAKELYKVYADWLARYPILSIEDPFAEDDWESWKLFARSKKRELRSKSKHKLLVVGDDLFTTNIKRLKTGVELGVANAILIKPNQIGTLTETMETIRYAQKNRYKVIISHRSGETCDTFISDLAVACGADFIKAGSLSREERLAKYNRLMEIEDEI